MFVLAAQVFHKALSLCNGFNSGDKRIFRLGGFHLVQKALQDLLGTKRSEIHYGFFLFVKPRLGFVAPGKKIRVELCCRFLQPAVHPNGG